MAENRLILRDVVDARNAITQEQRREIKRLYSEWAEEVSVYAAHYAQKNSASAYQYRELENMLIEASERISGDVEAIATANIRNMSNIVVSSNTKWMASLGFPAVEIAASMSSVPDAIVQRLVTGQIYESGWSLSKSIWTDNYRTQKQIYEIVAGGIAQNKSVYEISRDLERWVNPDKMRPWNLVNAKGRRIYPRPVDYNAQRLVRTLTQHSYQQSFGEAVKGNKLIEGVIWRANGSRACPACLELDGKLFAKDEVPLDHPNGMCVMEPALAPDWLQQLRDMLTGQ